MNFIIKVAKNAQEIDHVFSLRYRVLVEQEKYLPPNPDFRLYDRFDNLYSTINYIGYVESEPIGTIRFTQWSHVGMPSEDYFEFKNHLPYYDHRIISGSMFCILRDYRGIKHLAKFLVWIGVALAKEHDLTYLLAAINPSAKKFFLRLGFICVNNDEIILSKKGLPTIPMILDLSKVNEDYFNDNFKRIYAASFSSFFSKP
ncbi:MAG: GNAT family N-acyltransferase [Microcoleaceae cyanobacterium MO_207.B10]|nr:GNAT family N-acyltransferase [Microcoleaceae cyanobacterium MO_207.B10]